MDGNARYVSGAHGYFTTLVTYTSVPTGSIRSSGPKTVGNSSPIPDGARGPLSRYQGSRRPLMRIFFAASRVFSGVITSQGQEPIRSFVSERTNRRSVWP